MKRQLIAGVMALALAAGMTTSAMAFDHGGFHSGRFEGVRGFSGWRHGDWGSRRFVGGYRPYHDSGYGAGVGLDTGTYCPAYSRCGAGLGSGG